MCDEGRFGYPLRQRDRAAPAADASAATMQSKPAAVVHAVARGSRQVRRGRQESGSSVAAVLSPFLTVRGSVPAGEAISRTSVRKCRLALGPGAGRRRGRHVSEGPPRPADAAGEVHDPGREVPESPRRRGSAQAVPGHDRAVRKRAGCGRQRIDSGAVGDGVGYPRAAAIRSRTRGSPRIKPPSCARQTCSSYRICSPRRQARRPTYVLPSAAWSEKEGTFINHAVWRSPSLERRHAPGEGRSEGQVYADLMGRGLLHAATIRGEMAQKVGAFKDLASIAPLGTRLELRLV